MIAIINYRQNVIGKASGLDLMKVHCAGMGT